MPGIDDQVVCLLLPNTSGKGVGAGFILGAIYSNVDQPPTGAGERSRVLDHQGDLTIRVSGALSIEAGKMDVKAGDGVISTTGMSSLPGFLCEAIRTQGIVAAAPERRTHREEKSCM